MSWYVWHLFFETTWAALRLHAQKQKQPGSLKYQLYEQKKGSACNDTRKKDRNKPPGAANVWYLFGFVLFFGSDLKYRAR